MAGQKGKKNMNQKDFDFIKKLLDAGLSQAKTAELTGRSYATVTIVNKASTFEDYKMLIAARYKQPIPKPAEPSETAAVVDSVQANILQNINDALVSIDTRLKFLEENCVVPKSKLKIW